MSVIAINNAKVLINKANSLHTAKKYLDSKTKRNELSDIYVSMQNLGGQLPRPIGFNSKMYDRLRKRVSDSCPSCTSSALMTTYVNEAVAFIRNHAATLTEYIGSLAVDYKTNIHDLNSNL